MLYKPAIRGLYKPNVAGMIRWTDPSQRVNLLSSPDDLNNAAWDKINITIDDVLNEQAIMETVADGAHQLHQSIAKDAASQNYHIEFKVKGGLSRNEVYMVFASADQASGAQMYCDIDVPNVFSSFQYGSGFSIANASIELIDDYYHCECDISSDASDTIHFYIGISIDIGDTTYIGTITNGLWIRDPVVYRN